MPPDTPRQEGEGRPEWFHKGKPGKRRGRAYNARKGILGGSFSCEAAALFNFVIRFSARGPLRSLLCT